eukprot:sb/3470711/
MSTSSISHHLEEEPDPPFNGLSCSFDEHHDHHQPDTTAENPRKMKPEDYGCMKRLKVKSERLVREKRESSNGSEQSSPASTENDTSVENVQSSSVVLEISEDQENSNTNSDVESLNSGHPKDLDDPENNKNSKNGKKDTKDKNHKMMDDYVAEFERKRKNSKDTPVAILAIHVLNDFVRAEQTVEGDCREFHNVSSIWL